MISFERVGEIAKSKEQIKSIISDVKNEFPKVSDEDLIKALKKGSLGNYGKTYKMCSQEVCIWIRQYLKSIVRPTDNLPM